MLSNSEFGQTLVTYYFYLFFKELPRRYILCSCNSTVTTLKKYVALKIFKNLDQYKEIDICLNEEPLGKDHTLKFIQATNKRDKVTFFFNDNA